MSDEGCSGLLPWFVNGSKPEGIIEGLLDEEWKL